MDCLEVGDPDLNAAFGHLWIDTSVLTSGTRSGFAILWNLLCAAVDHHGRLCKCGRLDC